MDKKELYISCECGSEVMLLEYYKSSEACVLDEVTIAIYRLGYSKKPNLWQKLKYCWYHLTTGKRYEDQMIITPKKAKEIANWITNEIK